MKRKRPTTRRRLAVSQDASCPYTYRWTKCQLGNSRLLGTMQRISSLSALPVESAHQKYVEPAPLRVSDSLDVRETFFNGHVPPVVIIPVRQSAATVVRHTLSSSHSEIRNQRSFCTTQQPIGTRMLVLSSSALGMCEPVPVKLNYSVATAEIATLQGQVPQNRLIRELFPDVRAIVPTLGFHHAMWHSNYSPTVVKSKPKAPSVVAPVVVK